MSDPPLKRCRKCRGALRRTFHPVGIVLKGSGFHRNDYRSTKPGGSSSDQKEASGDKKESSGDKKESSSDTKKSSDAKSESSKPAAKSD